MKLITLTLSIVIPVYNEQGHLKSCLEAITRQTTKPQQVIVIDNNCTDDSMRIAKSYDFVTIIEEKKQGIVYARNRGFNAVTSDLIARIDADTVLAPNWVETAKALAHNNPNTAAFTGPCYFDTFLGKSFWFGLHRLIYFWSSRLYLGHTILFGSNMFIRRSTWSAVNNMVCLDTSIHEDMDLAYHVHQQKKQIQFTPKLRATISVRRFKHGWRYPKMWLKTGLVH